PSPPPLFPYTTLFRSTISSSNNDLHLSSFNVLTHLTLWHNSDNQIVAWPPNITHLVTTDGFTQSITNSPKSLTHVTIGNGYRERSEEHTSELQSPYDL